MAAHFEIRAIKDRLAMGAGSFDDLRKSVAALAETVKPKPVSWGKVALSVSGLIITALVAAMAYGVLTNKVDTHDRAIELLGAQFAEVRAWQMQTAGSVTLLTLQYGQLVERLDKPQPAEPSAASYGTKGAQRRR